MASPLSLSPLPPFFLSFFFCFCPPLAANGTGSRNPSDGKFAPADPSANSLSEWGCIKNRPREFEELSALMSDKMTSVYSGGLMYEYSLEQNEYGIVTLKSDSVDTSSSEYKNFKAALAKFPTPSGNGGAAETTHSVDCPSQDSSWNVDPSLVPVMPAQAEKYMKSGAGDGPGFGGDGSQDAGDSGTATASVTGGTPSPTSASSEQDNAAVSVRGSMDTMPVFISALVLSLTLLGAMLL